MQDLGDVLVENMCHGIVKGHEITLEDYVTCESLPRDVLYGIHGGKETESGCGNPVSKDFEL